MFKLLLNNFRGFNNAEFEFAKVNIIIGENSSGKSSLLKFFLAVKQTLESHRESNFLLSGARVDLGNFKNTVFENDINKKISFGFEFDKLITDKINGIIVNIINEILPSRKELKQKFNPLDGTFRIQFEINNLLDQHYQVKTTISNPTFGNVKIIRKKNKDKYFTKYEKCWIKFTDLKGRSTTYKEIEYDFTAFLSLVVPIGLIEQTRKKNIKTFKIDFQKMGALLLTQNEILDTFEKLKYINPMFSKPKRFFERKDRKSVYFDNDIEKFITFLSDKKLNQNVRKIIIEKLKKAFNSLEIGEDINIITPKNFPVSELKIKIDGKWRNITDVGYGVSLQLPLLFESIYSDIRGGDLILIEQPEVHLHPKLQAALIRSLIEICSRNDYIIETHSEHLVRKLQVLVKNKLIKPEDVRIYYLTKSPNGFKFSKHMINLNGTLSPLFPEGFFDQSYQLVEELFRG